MQLRDGVLAKKLAKREREKRVMLRCSCPIPINKISRIVGCYAHSSGLFNVWGSRGAAPCSRVVKVNVAETLPSGSGVRTRSSSNCSYDVASAVRQRWRRPSGQMRLRLARIAVVVVNDGRGDHLCGVVGQITTGPRQSGPTLEAVEISRFLLYVFSPASRSSPEQSNQSDNVSLFLQ